MKFSLGAGAGKTTSKPTSGALLSRETGQGKKRLAGVLAEDEEEEHHNGDSGDSTRISHFGAAIEDGSEKEKEAARTIHALPNRDWRQEGPRKKQKSGIPGQEGERQQAQVNGAGSATTEVFDPTTSGPQYGLNVFTAPEADAFSEQAHDATDINQPNGTPAIDHSPVSSTAASAAEPSPASDENSADQEALSRLLGHTTASAFTIIRPASPPPSEDDAFRAGYSSAPRIATLAEYAATPVEGYGAAILRGYLRGGETLESRIEAAAGAKVKKDSKGPKRQDADGTPIRRPGLLGLGAKDSGTAGVELGAWGGKGARKVVGKGGPRGREEVVYNPVTLRNRKTGELVTEEELKAMVEAQREDDARGGGSGGGAAGRKGYELDDGHERERERRGGKHGVRRDDEDDIEDDGGRDRRHRRNRDDDDDIDDRGVTKADKDRRSHRDHRDESNDPDHRHRRRDDRRDDRRERDGRDKYDGQAKHVDDDDRRHRRREERTDERRDRGDRDRDRVREDEHARERHRGSRHR